jgi:hypothetical protein
MIRNMNTIEDYRNLDMAAILNQAGRTVGYASTTYKQDVLTK